MLEKPISVAILWENPSQETHPKSVAICGTRSGYRDLIDLLRSGAAFTRTVTPPVYTTLTAYDGFLYKIIAMIGPEDLQISINGDALLVYGTIESFDVFAANIEFVTDPITAPTLPTHVHFEYYEGRPYLHPSSLPVVIEAIEPPTHS